MNRILSAFEQAELQKENKRLKERERALLQVYTEKKKRLNHLTKEIQQLFEEDFKNEIHSR